MEQDRPSIPSGMKNEDTVLGKMVGLKLAKIQDGDDKEDTKLEIMRLLSQIQRRTREL